MVFKLEYFPYVEDEINKHLPPQIRVFELQSIVRSFNFLKAINKRRYVYRAPLYLFSEGMEVSEELISKINSVCSLFVGNHNFHNFTRLKNADDPSCKRIIQRFYAQKCEYIDNTPFIEFVIEGQSFMLNQIRFFPLNFPL